MNDTQIMDALTRATAIRKGHFQLTSGRHSDTYVQCARILEDPQLTTELAQQMVARLPDDSFDLVVAPAVGGIIIGFAVAQTLGVPFLFTERQEGVMVLRRGFEIPPAARVLIVEDVVTTGGSVQEVVDLVQAAEARVAAVATVIDRGGDRAFDADYYPLLAMQVDSWLPSECAACQAGLPLDSPGSRRLG
ncbi:MAG: orotate phosphoribosyltransferase [Coriobacteriia bacterium]|nr:orotate phosphoribosyltransferase [Coriobacteriia bacterium]